MALQALPTDRTALAREVDLANNALAMPFRGPFLDGPHEFVPESSLERHVTARDFEIRATHACQRDPYDDGLVTRSRQSYVLDAGLTSIESKGTHERRS